MSSQIIGNAIGGYIIVRTSGPEFFIIMGIIMFVPSIALGFVIYPEKEDAAQLSDMKQEKPSMCQDIKSTLMLIFTGKMRYVSL
jgi:hypothetical protein